MKEKLEIDHTVQTFVRRSKRMTHFQKNAYDLFYSKWCIPFNNDSLNDRLGHDKFQFSSIFKNENPIIIEIGFGMGDATFQIAKENPNKNYLCIEVFKAGIASLLGKIESESLKNIRIIEGDAIKILERMIMVHSIEAFHFFFPDPWQKKKHNKRRFIRRPRTDLLQSKLVVNGYIYVVTDWEEYAYDAYKELEATPSLKSMFNGFAPLQPWRPKTKFERKAEKEGREVYEMMFVNE